MTDNEIILLYQNKKESAVSETNKKYRQKCFNISYRILSNREDVDECINDAYLVLWNNIPPDCPTNLLAYLLKIVKNLSLKRYEYNSAEKRGGKEPELIVAIDDIAEELISVHSVEKELDNKEIVKSINEFLETLPKNDRIMFIRRYWYGMAVKEIAEQFGITSHNATVKLSRITQKLKKHLQKVDLYE